MRCPTCSSLSPVPNHTVTQGRSTKTQHPYEAHWDERDVLHNHNPNVETVPYRCSNGHRWEAAVPTVPCLAPGCSWVGPHPDPSAPSIIAAITAPIPASVTAVAANTLASVAAASVAALTGLPTPGMTITT
jgi:hypothetical protein